MRISQDSVTRGLYKASYMTIFGTSLLEFTPTQQFFLIFLALVNLVDLTRIRTNRCKWTYLNERGPASVLSRVMGNQKKNPV